MESKDFVVDREGIKRLIPHREPFLFLDGVVEYREDEYAVCIYRFREDEWFYRGHFPEMPLTPGVIMLEAMAQAAAVLGCLSEGPILQDEVVVFMALDRVKFRKPVFPGDEVEIHVKVKHKRRGIWKQWIESRVDGRLVCEGEFTAMRKKR